MIGLHFYVCTITKLKPIAIHVIILNHVYKPIVLWKTFYVFKITESKPSAMMLSYFIMFIRPSYYAQS